MKAVSYVKVSAEEQIEAVISVESQTCAEVSGHSLPLSSACASTFSIPLPRPTWWFCELKLTCHSVTTTQEKNLPRHCPPNRLATAEIWLWKGFLRLCSRLTNLAGYASPGSDNIE